MTSSAPTPRLSLLTAVLFLSCFPIHAQIIPGWDLIWQDEFTQADGTPPDSTKWGYDIGGHGWGNNELQYYTNSTSNSRIEGNELIIEARQENFGGNSYTSARLLTKGKWDWTYGRFEARAKVPSGDGLWPAVWMLGSNIDAVSWPNCGEIDIMEQVGRLPKEVFGTIHGPGYSGGGGIGNTHTFVADVADDYHVFVVEWDPDIIRWYVDGINYFTATPASLGGNTWVFNLPQFLILNMAVGGNFAGPVGGGTAFPAILNVDYVRVYSRTVPAGTNSLTNPGLETNNLSPWTGYSLGGGSNPVGAFIESSAFSYYNGGNPGGDPVLTHSGQYVAKTFGDFDGGENFNGFYQDVTAAPGSVWTASAWALTHAQDLMSGNNTSWVEVSFRDASDTVLELYRSTVLTSANVTPSTWTELQITDQVDPITFAITGTVSSMTAPAGTASIRYQVVFQQPLFDGGSMYFDDLALLEQVVIAPFTHSTSRNGAQVQIAFDTLAGINYQILYKTNLSDPTWTPIESVSGDGTNKVFNYPMIDARRFFIVGASAP